jgi:hypothetical protein
MSSLIPSGQMFPSKLQIITDNAYEIFVLVLSTLLFIGPCGGGLEYLHRSPASGKRRRKGYSVPEGITGPLCSKGI